MSKLEMIYREFYSMFKGFVLMSKKTSSYISNHLMN